MLTIVDTIGKVTALAKGPLVDKAREKAREAGLLLPEYVVSAIGMAVCIDDMEKEGTFVYIDNEGKRYGLDFKAARTQVKSDTRLDGWKE